ncbi:Dirigent protein [Dillenia turbinata]|uniref:Dirigent protein n=1 Tax=Dillenia turbinata TaxID=194707 RepID=A0AAN8UPK3_9MAGN
MVFHWQDWNTTTATVTKLPSYKSGFGTIQVADDALTESLDRNSTQVGRAQGMYVTSALDGSDFHILVSFVFCSKEYNGSTLEIQGSDRLFEKYREVSIVSGTGKFRLARGFIIMETVFIDTKANNAIKMAPYKALKPLTSFSIILLAISISIEAKSQQKQTNLVFYMHDVIVGKNATAMAVAGRGNQPWKPLEFGTIFVIDDKLTQAQDGNSAQIGRAHGLYVSSTLDKSAIRMTMSLVFSNEKFNGSTLEIQGPDTFLANPREVAVVSGTGKFRLARGCAFMETAFADLSTFNSILKWNVTVFHY